MSELKYRYFRLQGAAVQAAEEFERAYDAMVAERKKWIEDTFGPRNFYSLNREQIHALEIKKANEKHAGLREKVIVTRGKNDRPLEVLVLVPDKRMKIGREYAKKFESFQRPSIKPVAHAIGIDQTRFHIVGSDGHFRITNLDIAHLGGHWYTAIPDKMFTEGEEPGHKTNKLLMVNAETCVQVPEWEYLKAVDDAEKDRQTSGEQPHG